MRRWEGASLCTLASKTLHSTTKEAKGLRVYGAPQQWDDPHCCVINGENDKRDGC